MSENPTTWQEKYYKKLYENLMNNEMKYSINSKRPITDYEQRQIDRCIEQYEWKSLRKGLWHNDPRLLHNIRSNP